MTTMRMRIWGVALLAAGIVVFVPGVWMWWIGFHGANDGGVWGFLIGGFLILGVIWGPILFATGLVLLYRSARTKERAAV